MLPKLIPVFIALIAISCSKTCGDVQREVRSMMGVNYKKQIVFPEEMEIINPAADPAGLSSAKRYKIVHFFTADCNECINELAYIQSFLETNPATEVIDLIFIASGPTKYYVAEAVEKIKFSYPTFYEKQYFSFKLLNNLPLDQDVYNTMILNDKNEVLLFGSYFSNQKAKKLFSEILKCGF